MAKADNHLLTYASVGLGAYFLWKNRGTILNDVQSLVPATTLPTTDSTSSPITVQTPAPIVVQSPPTQYSPPVSQQPILVSSPSLTAQDIVNALTNVNAAKNQGQNTVIVPLTPTPIQTPYGPVTPSNFTNPTEAPLLSPPVTIIQSPPPPPVLALPPAAPALPFTQADVQHVLDVYSHNYYDYQNAIHGDPGTPASNAPSYKANVDRAGAMLDQWYAMGPHLFTGLDLRPWRG